MAKNKINLRSLRHLSSIRTAVKGLSDPAIHLAEGIADLAEPPMKEFKSADLLAEFLRSQGFKVTRPWKNLPTAFLAVAGKDGPAVALLAEYDALPDCGPRVGQWGHGCGHHLLGTASALAGVVAVKVLRDKGIGAKIMVIGTPAEETLGGKVFIGQQRGYAGIDAALAWHPGSDTEADLGGGTAMDSILFHFSGRTAHAAAEPHNARSALDAAMLMDVAVNYLREHVESNVRMHSVIIDGGKAPNVVPDRSTIWYYLRGRDRKQVDAVRQRVVRCARGAALATETTLRVDLLTGCTERLANRTMADLMDAVMRRCGSPKFTPADIRAARHIISGKYSTKIRPIQTRQISSSSDEDNVSWFAPLGRISVACVPNDTVVHHRQFTAACRTSGAHRGMLKAAEMLAAGAVELALNSPLLRKAQAEFRKVRRGKKYDLPLSPRAVELSIALAEKTMPK